MILCSRCSTMVDERTRTTCPRCFAPISPAQPMPPQGPGYPPQAPQVGMPPYTPPSVPPLPSGYTPPPGSPYAPPSGMATAPTQSQGGMPNIPAQQTPPQAMGAPGAYGQPTRTRVSLTGEVIQDTAPPPAPPYSGASGMQPPYPGVGQRPPGGYPPPAPAKSGPNGRNLGLSIGGGSLVVLYILLRVGLVIWRVTHIMDVNNRNNSNVSSPYNGDYGANNPYNSGGFSRPVSPTSSTPPGFYNPPQNLPNPPVMPSPPSGFRPGMMPRGPQNMPGAPTGFGPGSIPHGPPNIPGPPGGFGSRPGGFGGGYPGSGGSFGGSGQAPAPSDGTGG